MTDGFLLGEEMEDGQAPLLHGVPESRREVRRKRGVHGQDTAHRQEVQQLREAFPFDTALRHLIFDRDSIFSAHVVSTVRSFGIEPSRTGYRTGYRSPWQNGVAERWVLSIRREPTRVEL